MHFGSTVASWATDTSALVLDAGGLLNCNALIRAVKAFLTQTKACLSNLIGSSTTRPTLS